MNKLKAEEVDSGSVILYCNINTTSTIKCKLLLLLHQPKYIMQIHKALIFKGEPLVGHSSLNLRVCGLGTRFPKFWLGVPSVPWQDIEP